MVIGNRMANIQPGAMPWLHRYIGNPILTGILNLFFRTGVARRPLRHARHPARRPAAARPARDRHGVRLRDGDPRLQGAARRSSEFPIEYHPRGGESKLSTLRDGWRHLRFLLVHSPTHLFIVPGVVLAFIGTIITALAVAEARVFGHTFQEHTLIAGSLLMVVGTQTIGMGVCARAYGYFLMGERSPVLDRFRLRFKLEDILLAGVAVIVAGLAAMVYVAVVWADRGFGSLGEERFAILGSTFFIIGIQIVFSAFLVSIIGLRRTSN